ALGRPARPGPQAPPGGVRRDAPSEGSTKALAAMGRGLGGGARAGLREIVARGARGVLRAAARPRSHAHPRAAPARRRPHERVRRDLRVARAAMNERAPMEDGAGVDATMPGYAGKPRDAQLEYKAILANVSIGVAFTRERRFTLCNPKFAEMFGWKMEELIG